MYCQQFMTDFTFQKNKNTDTSKGSYTNTWQADGGLDMVL